MKYVIFVIVFLCVVQTTWAQKDEYFVQLVKKGSGRVNAIDINEDNTLLLLGTENKQAIVYDLKSKKVVFEVEAHYQPVIDVNFSKVDNVFYSVGDRSIKVWKIGSEKPEKIYTGTVTNLTSWSSTANEAFFVASSYNKKFCFWEAAQLKAVKEVETGHKKNIIATAISDDHKWVVTGALDTSIEVWNVETDTRKHLLLAHSRPISCVEFVSNNKYIISASHDGNARLWDMASGQAVQMYLGHSLPVSSIAISPSGKFFLMASYDHTIGLFNVATGERIHVYQAHESPVLDVVWNHKGNGFYSCDKDGNVMEWSVPDKVFVDFYFGKEIASELAESKLLLPRKKGEAKDAYKDRVARAEKLKNKLQEKYYLAYLELQKTFIVGE